MLGTLTRAQCDFILTRNNVGRIGCCAAGKPYIVPITYVYDDGIIYGHSYEGLKIKMMRKNNNVCFEVDNIDDLANWRSVIAFGKYEELKTVAQQQKAKVLFMERLLPLTLGASVSPAREFAEPPRHVEKKTKPILFRIKAEEVTGRFEKQIVE